MASHKVTIWKCDKQKCDVEIRSVEDNIPEGWSQVTYDGRVLDLCIEHAKEPKPKPDLGRRWAARVAQGWEFTTSPQGNTRLPCVLIGADNDTHRDEWPHGYTYSGEDPVETLQKLLALMDERIGEIE